MSQFVNLHHVFWRANAFVTVYGLVGEEIAVGGKKMWLYLRAKTASFSIFCAAIASEKKAKKLVLPFEGSSSLPQPTLKTDSNKKILSCHVPSH